MLPFPRWTLQYRLLKGDLLLTYVMLTSNYSKTVLFYDRNTMVIKWCLFGHMR